MPAATEVESAACPGWTWRAPFGRRGRPNRPIRTGAEPCMGASCPGEAQSREDRRRATGRGSGAHPTGVRSSQATPKGAQSHPVGATARHRPQRTAPISVKAPGLAGRRPAGFVSQGLGWLCEWRWVRCLRIRQASSTSRTRARRARAISARDGPLHSGVGVPRALSAGQARAAIAAALLRHRRCAPSVCLMGQRLDNLGLSLGLFDVR